MALTTLCLDFGNSRRKGVLFSDDIIEQEFSFENPGPEEINQVIRKWSPQRSILASVVEHDAAVEELLAAKTAFHRITSNSKLPFSIAVSKKETIGADRLALIAGAVRFYPGMNTLVVGIGTCITYNFVNKYNTFLGGSISPGMEMRFRSMHEFTAKLPLASASFNIPFTGYDTVTNLQSGVVNGITAEMDGIILKYAEKYGNFNVLLTGGHSAYFAGQLKNKIFADFNFLFKGLYALSEINCHP